MDPGWENRYWAPHFLVSGFEVLWVVVVESVDVIQLGLRRSGFVDFAHRGEFIVHWLGVVRGVLFIIILEHSRK